MCVERVGGEAGRGALVRGGADGHGRGRSGRGGGGGGDGHAWVEKGGWTGLGSWVEVDSAGYLAGGGDAKNEGLVANRPARKGSGQTAFGSEYAYMYLSIYRIHSQYRGI